MVICELDETEILETSGESSARLSVDRVIVAQGRQGRREEGEPDER